MKKLTLKKMTVCSLITLSSFNLNASPVAVDCASDPFNAACGFNSNKAKSAQVLCNDGKVIDVNGDGNIQIDGADKGISAKNKFGKFKNLAQFCTSGVSAVLENGAINIDISGQLGSTLNTSDVSAAVNSSSSQSTDVSVDISQGYWNLPSLPFGDLSQFEHLGSSGPGSSGPGSSGPGSS